MNALLRLPSTYLSLPMLAACALTVLTYELPPAYFAGLALLAGTALAILLFDVCAGMRVAPAERLRARDNVGTRDGFVALAFAWLIVASCVLDLSAFSIPLISDPGAYASMDGGRAHVRHISNICWVLPVIGLLCARQRWVRHTLIAIGLVFPILVIDRNRMCAGVFALLLVLVLKRDPQRRWPWPTIIALGAATAAAFSLLGVLRSGPLENLTLPFGALYEASPQSIKWLLLYITAGPYNFAAMVAKDYANAQFLLAQLLPVSGAMTTAGSGIPLDAATINVGTEFLPFLLALGPFGAAAAMLVLYAWLLWSVQRLRLSASIFPMLVFARMAYVCVMAPFAPQAYTWTNVGFVVLCFVLQAFASLLPNRQREQAPAVSAVRPAL